MENVKEILAYIDPAKLDYSDWVEVGMALKEAGETADTWEEWSSPDPRHKPGECFAKWESFQGSSGGAPVTAGTLVHLAKQYGYQPGGRYSGPDGDEDLDFSGYVSAASGEREPIKYNIPWDEADQASAWLQALFEPDEIVAFVTESFLNDKGKYVPANRGSYTTTCAQLLNQLEQYKTIEYAFGAYDKAAGVWARINPMDGKGVKNDNVASYKYALVESDELPIEEQNSLYRDLNLPIAALVHSGGRSLHAIVKVEATSRSEYSKRVAKLYSVCEQNGLSIDSGNSNPSRLSRLPGAVRGNNKQRLIDTNIGASGWDEWVEWLDSQTDDLDDPVSLADFWDSPPPLKDELISGILRVGHKMLIAASSKAGKSYLLLELAAAMAEGGEWLGHKVKQGKVLYVNLELDADSCVNRAIDIYHAMGIQKPTHPDNLRIWQLRGCAEPFNKLCNKLIRRLKKDDYLAVIIDPIYKVITGDENSAAEMAMFCNLFDRVCKEANCAAIYCHHFSKGAQGSKRSMDRASGSGVFARDPDAIITLTELVTDENYKSEQRQTLIVKEAKRRLDQLGVGYMDLDSGILQSGPNLMAEVQKADPDYYNWAAWLEKRKDALNKRTAWRIDMTLREFPPQEPSDCLFEYPIHYMDTSGQLAKFEPESAMQNNRQPGRKKRSSEESKTVLQEVEDAVQVLSAGGFPSLEEVAGYLEISEKTARRRLKESKKYSVNDGKIEGK